MKGQQGEAREGGQRTRGLAWEIMREEELWSRWRMN